VLTYAISSNVVGEFRSDCSKWISSASVSSDLKALYKFGYYYDYYY